MDSIKSQENKNAVHKPECPICRRNNVAIDKQRRIKPMARSRRRGKNKEDPQNEFYEDTGSGQESDSVGSFSLEPPSVEEVKRRNEQMLRHRLAAFDEDYASQMTPIVFK